MLLICRASRLRGYGKYIGIVLYTQGPQPCFSPEYVANHQQLHYLNFTVRNAQPFIGEAVAALLSSGVFCK